VKPFRIILLLLVIILFLLALAGLHYWYKATHKTATKHTTTSWPAMPAAYAKMQSKAKAAKQFATAKKFNTKFCIMIDMEAGSGSKRCFLYDMQKDSVLDAGLVTHGRCNETWLTGRKYSNVVGSGCTSPGRYKIGKPYEGTFGLAYKLYGLDATNSNAFRRYVVLHSHECVPENEVDPYPICQSDGCPTVSPGFLKKLATFIDGSSRPVLLWIYE
jgi:hypothetical protein